MCKALCSLSCCHRDVSERETMHPRAGGEERRHAGNVRSQENRCSLCFASHARDKPSAWAGARGAEGEESSAGEIHL